MIRLTVPSRRAAHGAARHAQLSGHVLLAVACYRSCTTAAAHQTAWQWYFSADHLFQSPQFFAYFLLRLCKHSGSNPNPLVLIHLCCKYALQSSPPIHPLPGISLSVSPKVILILLSLYTAGVQQIAAVACNPSTGRRNLEPATSLGGAGRPWRRTGAPWISPTEQEWWAVLW